MSFSRGIAVGGRVFLVAIIVELGAGFASRPSNAPIKKRR